MHARPNGWGPRFFVAVAVAATLAFAGASAGASPEGETEARALYKRALAAYDLGEYDRAIADFKQCYELSGRAELLFNLGQAYRAKRDYEAALHSYRTFLQLKPNASNRVEVEGFIGDVERAQASASAQQPTTTQPPPTTTQPPPPTTTTTQPPLTTTQSRPMMPAQEREAPPSYLKNPPGRPEPPPVHPLGYPERTLSAPPINRPLFERPPFLRTTRGRGVIALSAVGAALLIAAAATGGSALDERGRYDRGCDLGACDHSLYAGAHDLAIATDVLLAVGIANGVAALLWAVIHPRAEHPRAERPRTLAGIAF